MAAKKKPARDRPLTPKQQLFVLEYLKDLNATSAAARAGYKDPNIGRQLITKNNVAAAIEKAKADRANEVKVEAAYVLANLTEVVERCMQRAPVMVREGREFVQLVDEEGRHVWQFNGKVAVAALAKLGEHLGLFVKKVAPVNPDGQTPYDSGAGGVAPLLAEVRAALDRFRCAAGGDTG